MSRGDTTMASKYTSKELAAMHKTAARRLRLGYTRGRVRIGGWFLRVHNGGASLITLYSVRSPNTNDGWLDCEYTEAL